MSSPVAVPPRRAATADEFSALRVTEVELFSVAGHDGYLREVNSAFAQLLGRQPEAVHGSSLLEFVHPEDLPDVVGAICALDSGAAEVQVENRFARADGSWFHLDWIARPIEGTELWWAAGRDTSEIHRLILERSHLQTRLELSLGQATAAMWEWSVGTGRLTWEQQAAELFAGASEPPADVAAFVALVDARDHDAVASGFAELATNGSVDVAARIGSDGVLRHLSVRGKVLDRDRRGRAVRAVGLVLDVTTEKAMEEQMLRMIMSDGLTGVPNRRAFDQALRTQWRRCIREGLPVSVAMIDIDNFKLFNDTFGHLVGDEVLCSVARALSNALREEGDLLARFGGEEFAIVLPGAGPDAARDAADRLLQAVRSVTLRQAPDWKLSVSIGTAGWQPGDPVVKSGDALARADRALYAAKQAGKDRAAAAG